MARMEDYIEALKSWRKQANPMITSYPELVFQLAYDLGCRWDSGAELKEAVEDDYLRMLDEQAYYLINEQNISESLLIAGLTEATAAYIHRPLAEREADIAYLEKMLAEVDEVDNLLHKLVQLKDPAFEQTVLAELECWRRLSEKLF